MNIIGKVLGIFGKAVAFFIIAAIVAPIVYLVWRAGQPMSMPQYGGRTYYELLAERLQGYDTLATQYQASHPNVEVKFGMCYQAEVFVSMVDTLPWSGLCAASEFIPALRVYGSRAKQLGCGKMGGTWANFPLTWWRTYEKLLYADILSTRPQGPVAYCRLAPPQ